MKKYLLVLLLIVAFAGKGLTQTNADKLLGYWTSAETAVGMVFYHDNNMNLRAICWDKGDGEVLQITNLVETDSGEVEFDMLTVSTNWKIHARFSIADDGTMVEQLKNPNGNVVVHWTRE